MIDDTKNPELNRFLVLFDRLVHFTRDGVAATPVDKLEWVPTEGDTVRFGTRLSNVTIRALCVHLFVGENKWARVLRDCEDGAVIDIPNDPALTATMEGEDFLDVAMKVHEETMGIFRAFSESDLRKSVSFANRKWSMMGFLWAIYGHHNYHHGNIDIYWRLSGCEAMDYFNFEPREMA
jgi:uncharacterized damage-inducible protein DinB